ncbi:UNVERIFIED_CONTAM: hypothetical protein GTU68_064472 [Idotea baltica]|nr:hypothetical protein [Idotea baltica]
MKVLVTGAAGFIGSHLSHNLLNKGYDVIGIDNFNNFYSPEVKRNNIKKLSKHKSFKFIEGSFCNKETVLKLFLEKPDTVAHLGAMANVRYSVKHPDLFVDTNVVGTNNLLEFACKNNVKNFVFASTSSIYGQREKTPFIETDSTDLPLAPYPATKKAGELLGHAYHNMNKLNFTALRFFNVYGPAGRPDMMPYIVTEKLVEDEEITLFDNGKMFRDWTYIDDIVSGVTLALENPLGYEILNLGRGEPVEMTEFLEITQNLTGKKAIINVIDAPESEPKITCASIDKARKLLGYDPKTNLKDGLSNFWDWYKENII